MSDGYYVDTECGVELCTGMAFANKDKSIGISWEAYESDGNVEDGLKHIIETGGFKVIIPIILI